MHIKRFQAPDINKALEKVKEEFGDDAIILRTNRVKKRDPYTNQIESFIEIVAAIDTDRLNKTQIHDTKNDPITKEVLRAETPSIQVEKNQPQTITQPTFNQSLLLSLYQIFLEVGVPLEKHNEFTVRYLNKFENAKIDFASIKSWILDECKKDLMFGQGLEELPPPVIVPVIGPTGSGKTVTTAKLAAELKFNHNKNGILLSIDNYRLGAIEHLKRYAELMEVPFLFAKNPKHLGELIQEILDRDFILIDTFGKSIFDRGYEQDLFEIMEVLPKRKYPICIIPTNLSVSTLRKIVEFYMRFPIHSWVLTKTDEVESLIPVFMLCAQKNLPISYLCDGQKIPDNLLKANLMNINRITLKINELLSHEKKTPVDAPKREKSKLEILREIQG